ncbi:hypothetical protein QYE76_050673 [Lolium multiflorum]|uniref:Uncharacterized protein n=1 Tax=Lolium multiflorum TaxID=4521 RepID=A0AAD8WHI3_LOLMU|nr:hypothetical protein QYE76_050673 [Lolium multiflorum]
MTSTAPAAGAATSGATSTGTSTATSSSLSTTINPTFRAPTPRHSSFTLSTISLCGQPEDVLDLQRGSYALWRDRVEMKLAIYQVLDHVISDVANPADPEWLSLDFIIKGWIYDLITPELRTAVSSPGATARTIWVAIETLFRNNGLARAMMLSDEFRNTKQLENPLSVYIGKLKAISDEHRDLGYPLETHALLLQLVCGLHERHETIGKYIQTEAATLDLLRLRGGQALHG